MLLVTLLLNVMLLNDPSIILNTSAVKGSYICHYLFMQVNIIQHVYNISKSFLFLYEKIKNRKTKKKRNQRKRRRGITGVPSQMRTVPDTRWVRHYHDMR